jgi:biotin carboxylase
MHPLPIAGGAGPSSAPATSSAMASPLSHVFVIGLDAFNAGLIARLPGVMAHRLLQPGQIARGGPHDVDALLALAEAQVRAFAGRVDAIVGYWDFPTVLMMPILRSRVGLPGPSLESVLRCEHKYWSRCEQSRICPEAVPRFALVDPFDDASVAQIPLSFPYWLKPIKAHSSLLGFRIRHADDLAHAIPQIRADIHLFARPMDQIMGYAELPDDIATVHGGYCIAEEIISSGRQCTLEGYVLNGEVHIYGVVDSIRSRNRSSFKRYEYPSQLTRPIQAKMKNIARAVVGHLGLDRSPFNIEFFYQASRDRVWLLEINARISKSHSPLFEKVDGRSNHGVMIDVALGRPPSRPREGGQYRHAAKFMPRVYAAGPNTRLLDVATEEEIADIQRRFPGTEIQLDVGRGRRIADSNYKDSYSHQLATIFMGAQSHPALLKNYRACLKALRFRVGESDETDPRHP